LSVIPAFIDLHFVEGKAKVWQYKHFFDEKDPYQTTIDVSEYYLYGLSLVMDIAILVVTICTVCRMHTLCKL
jgi:lipopolysaccharide/colanic/teichoic acid biosynthesis glycosyltransferase